MGWSDNSLDTADQVGEVSDLGGMGGNVVQTLDQGASIFGHGGGSSGGFVPGTSLSLDPGAGATSPLFTETLGVQRAFNGLGAITGGIGAYQGFQDATDETKPGADRAAGVGNVFSGGIGALGGLIGTIAPEATGFLGGLAQAGGSLGLGASATAGSTWGVGAGLAGVGTALSTSAAVVGAGTAGWGVGRYGDKNAANTDWLRDKNGKGQSITDWGSDLSVRADENVSGFVGGEEGSWQHAIGSGLGGVAGYGTNALTSLLGVPLAIGSTAVGLDNALGGVPSTMLACTTGGASTSTARAMGAAVDFAHWLTD